jgi:hypothetical protein
MTLAKDAESISEELRRAAFSLDDRSKVELAALLIVAADMLRHLCITGERPVFQLAEMDPKRQA